MAQNSRTIVLDLHMALQTITTFISKSMTEPTPITMPDTCAVTIDTDTWEDMGSPHQLTVTLEPGNTLPQPENPKFVLVGTITRSVLRNDGC